MKLNIGIYKLFIGVVLLLNVPSATAQKTYTGDDNGIIRCTIPETPPDQVFQLQKAREKWLQAGNFPNTTTITIPVAFHVIRYSDSTANVTDQQINDQIDVLNSSYANTNITFSLHSIERVNNDTWVNADLYSAAEAAMKDSLAIDPAHVLNFYTNDLPGGGLGYARFPWEFPEDSYMHGVVCDYASLPDGSITNYDEGDTGVHEVGHYLGLWHTFQNGCDEPGDEVDDTPYEQSPAFGCPSGRNTCPDPEPDPIHNFMDYTYDSCMDHFTSGQSDRIDIILPQYRPSMLPIQVVVDQRRQSNEQLTGTAVDRWENSSFSNYTVPIPAFNFTVGSIEVLRGMQDVVNNPTEKYNRWIKNQTTDDPDVRNHHQFEITSDMDTLTSRFKQTHATITICNEFLSAPDADPEGDVVDFKDPWLIDYPDPLYGNNKRNQGMSAPFKSRPSPFNPDYTTPYDGDVYQGVFLNQGLTPQGQWVPPYYSVRAAQSQIIPFHGQDITWYFQGWKGDPDSVAYQYADRESTAVVFKKDGAVARAMYKGHLVSSSPQATAFNNGRVVAYEYSYPTSHWHLVYEDGGQIYYTYSTDGGTNWHAEKKLSYGETGVNSQPSIFLFQSEIGLPEEVEPDTTSPILLGVVWNREVGYINNNPVLRFKRINGSWSPEIVLSTMFPDNCQHVISGRMINYTPILYVICRYNPIGLYGLALFKISEASPWFSLVSDKIISGTSFYSKNPTITVDQGGVFHFCWEEGNKIYYSNYAAGSYFPAPLEISGPSWEGYNHRPSITMDYLGKINVVWEQQGITYPGTSFNHRQCDGGEWGAIQRVTAHYQFLNFPSVGAIHESEVGELKSSFVHETLSEDDPHINWLSYNGEKWTWQTEAFPGQHPGMSAYGLELMTVWTNHTLGLPYLVKNQQGETDEVVAENRESLSQDHYRTLLVDLKDIPAQRLEGEVSVSIGKVEVLTTQGTQTVSFPALSDSLSLQCFTQTSPFLVTENFQQLNFYYRLWMKNFHHTLKVPKTALYKIILQENTANSVVLRELNLSSILTDSLIFEEQVSINLLPYRGKTIHLRILVLPEYQSLLQNNITRVDIREYSRQMVGEQLVVESILNDQNIDIPKEFGLHQNYPNPFNPATTIAFDLPKDVRVRLEIFDVAGRLICTLVNETREAGTHQVIWNGKDDHGNSVASGVYVYRIQAGDFVPSRKMIFMK